MPKEQYPDPPASDETIRQIKDKIIKPGLANQCVTLITFWGSGKTSQIKYLLSYPEITFTEGDSRIFSVLDLEKFTADPRTAISYTINLIKTHFVKHPNKSVSEAVVDIVIADASNPEGFLNLINTLTFTKSLGITFMIEKAHLLLLKENETLRTFISAVHQTNPMKISFIYNVPCEIDYEQKSNLGDLATTFLQNIIYSSDIPWDETTAKRFISNEEIYAKRTLSEEFRKKSIELTNSDPQSHKIIVDRAINDPNFEKYSIEENVAKSIYDRIGDDLLEARFAPILQNVSKDSLNFLLGKADKPTEYLIRTGLVKESKEQVYKFMNPLFEEFLRRSSNSVYSGIGKLPAVIRNNITFQEGNLIESLLENENRLLSRESAAKILWEEKWEETYTDWALDKAISRLRKKLKEAGFEKNLKTIKGRGFALQ